MSFTDFSLFDTQSGQLSHYKRSSTPEDPSKAIMGGIQEILAEQHIDPMDVSYLAHGTTVATNALIEKKGARMGLITTQGFKDLMEIGWQRRPSLYDLRKPKPESLIPAGMRQEVQGPLQCVPCSPSSIPLMKTGSRRSFRRSIPAYTSPPLTIW